MQKVLVVCGPTATGKTKLALRLAKKINGELISADSRQVYRGMDIGTGKELPVNLKPQISDLKYRGEPIVFYSILGVKVWGYDLVSPTRQFNVAQYKRFADKILKSIVDRGKLPIIVGGTGLYIKAVVDDISTINVPANRSLRRSLANKSVDELYNLLSRFDPIKSASLNTSDRKNPRRLIRAIEVVSYGEKGRRSLKKDSKFDTLFIGLTLPKHIRNDNINKRVHKRLHQGIIAEIKKLLNSGVKWSDQSMCSIGYKELRGYFESKLTLEEVVKKWKDAEHNYAKRQITWFKRDQRINWFDVSKKDYLRNMENMVEKWYKS
ncbi:tRNA (adenosine(37)-N6)-dimethylallyltransferase MiaA [candidate division WWE3 bacterium RBG_16_37_10]|uniref:tRNA dimethylallyltransferase n=1 Tax=candidate division WWE3 bacterium RBG_16_37_10 TaxID=1802610 RepID=A0A1F4V4H6_UNCKA|nr:MAG: tRNA (adenosine(37)-N6)-dimethylallyltransferase MiaA [candidate division WWE3 bacterium RBG_16_37_10]